MESRLEAYILGWYDRFMRVGLVPDRDGGAGCSHEVGRTCACQDWGS